MILSGCKSTEFLDLRSRNLYHIKSKQKVALSFSFSFVTTWWLLTIFLSAKSDVNQWLQRNMKTNIIVTGFGPFQGHQVNASWESVKLLPEKWSDDKYNLVIEEIPVKYDFVQKQVPEKWADLKPAFYIHVGVSHIAQMVTLETLAHNKCYDRPDVDGELPKNQW